MLQPVRCTYFHIFNGTKRKSSSFSQFIQLRERKDGERVVRMLLRLNASDFSRSLSAAILRPNSMLATCCLFYKWNKKEQTINQLIKQSSSQIAKRQFLRYFSL